MMYANDEIFNIRYNNKMDRLEIKKPNVVSRAFKFFGVHKIITTAIVMFVIFSAINCMLIYNFMEILKNV